MLFSIFVAIDKHGLPETGSQLILRTCFLPKVLFFIVCISEEKLFIQF